MTIPSIPPEVGDAGRLAALTSYQILDTPAEPGFDDIVQLACRLCETPVALVSLVAEDRQWFKANIGFPHCQTDLSSSVCAHALAEPDRLLVIPDLTQDARTSANPLVTGEPFIRFYAGAPLVMADGDVLGTLCVIDRERRPQGLSEAQLGDLRALARQVVTQLELRRAVITRDALLAREAAAHEARDALRETQASMVGTGDADTTLNDVVAGALRAVPAADGGVVELFDGDDLVYRAVGGRRAPDVGTRIPLKGSVAGACAMTKTPILLTDAWAHPLVDRSLAQRLGMRSAVLAPIQRGDEVLGVLKLQSQHPDAFSPDDLDQVRLFAGAAAAGFVKTAETQALAHGQAREVFWRGLFDRLNEGFIIGEVIRDEAGRIVDWRYAETNPAWGESLGIDHRAVIGRTVREVLPQIEQCWISDFATVVETGEPATFTRQVAQLRRWYEGRAFRLDKQRFGVLFLEVTGRVEAEQRRTALLQIGDQLQNMTSIPDMTRAVAEIVGVTLGSTRAGFGRLDAEGETVEIEPDWTAPGVSSIAGHHRFEDYGDIRRGLLNGDPLVIEDVTTDPRTRDDPRPMQALQIRALVNMPVRENGRTVAVFILQDDKPRSWSAECLSFLRNVAARLETTIARMRAEERQAVLNHELSHRLKNTLAIVQSIAAQTLRGVSEREMVVAFERRVLALSRAHDVLMQKSWSNARMREVMDGVLSLQTDLDRFVFDGPDIDISPETALSLSLLLHELTTNALKYGALSLASGRVVVRWSVEATDRPMLVVRWSEEGGPPVQAPTSRQGFGSKLIRMGLLGTRAADLRYEPAGFQATFRAPLAEVQAR